MHPRGARRGAASPPTRSRPSARRACARAWCSTTRAADEIWACPNVDSRAGRRGDGARPLRRGAGDLRPRRRLGRRSPRRRASSGSRATSRTSSPSIAHVGMLGDWILTKLSGEFVTDPSLGSSSGMFELADARLVGPHARDLRARPLGLSRRRRAGHGRRRGDAPRPRRQTGLREGTPVVAGGADTQLALLGHRRHAAGPLHRRRRQLLAAHRRARRAADRPAGAAAHALPHRARPLDDRGHRLLLRDRDALVPRRVLRAPRSQRRRATASTSTTLLERQGGVGAARRRTASSGSSPT